MGADFCLNAAANRKKLTGSRKSAITTASGWLPKPGDDWRIRAAILTKAPETRFSADAMVSEGQPRGLDRDCKVGVWDLSSHPFLNASAPRE